MSDGVVILGIESSCDETACALVADGRRVLASAVASQIDLHARFGGVVPEIASRAHIEAVNGVIQRALDDAGVARREIRAVAVTCEPGLIGSLLVGLMAAKTLAWAWRLPLVGVNHVYAHAYAAALDDEPIEYPATALICSGGHTALYHCLSPTRMELLGSTIVTYGMGWFIEPYRESTLIYHGGNLEGHSLIVGFVPQEKAGVVVLTNVAGLPLRDVLLYDGIDRALGVADRDWNTRFHRAYDPIIVATAKGKRTSAAERLEDAPKTHPLVSYTGTFAASGYPDFAVRLRNDELEACTMGSFDWSGLRHYHYDVFEWHLSDFNMWMKVSFITGDTGEIDEISIPIEPSVENVVFRRKPLVLAREIAAALEGDYDSPVDGIIYTVSMRDGKTFIAETGRPPEEIVPYVLTPGSVTFKKKRVRFDFERGGEAIMRLVIKAPGMTLEAPRIV